MARESIFLGRTDEIRRFEGALDDLTQDIYSTRDWASVILIHGLGGIGKSTLMRRFHELVDEPCAVAWLDFEEARKDLPQFFGSDYGPGLQPVLDSIMQACLEGLEKHGDRQAGEKAFDDYRADIVRLPKLLETARAAVAAGEQTGLTKEDIAAAEKSAVALGALLTGQPITWPVGAAAAASLGTAALSHRSLFRRFMGKPQVDAHDYELLTDPFDALAKSFGAGFAACSQHRPLIVFLDTSEIVLAQMRPLRRVMEASGGRVMWVVGLRLEPDAVADGDSEMARFVRQVPNEQLRLMNLSRFDEHTVRDYLQRRLPDRQLSDGDVGQVYEFTKGLPLAVSLVADLLTQGATLEETCAVITRPTDSLEPIAPGQVVQTLARRFLVHLERRHDVGAHQGTSQQDLHRILCLAIANGAPTRSPEILRALWDTHEDLYGALCDLAARHDFVLSGTFRLHDDVRDALRNDLMDPIRRTRIAPACRRAADAIGRLLTDRRMLLPDLADQLASPEYQALLLDYIWYTFWADSIAGWSAALEILPVLAVTQNDSEEALLETVHWFAERTGNEGSTQFQQLAEPKTLSFLDEWLAKRQGRSHTPGSYRLRRSPQAVELICRTPQSTDLLGTGDDRNTTLTLLRAQHLLTADIDDSTLSATTDHLVNLGNAASRALIKPIADSLSKIADHAAKKDPKAPRLALAARTLLTADALSPQKPWTLDAMAQRIGKQDPDRADSLFKRAIQRASEPAPHLSNYANFLTYIRRDHDQAEEMYQRALTTEPNDPFTLADYADFLKTIRRDHASAEYAYIQALINGVSPWW